MSEQRESESGLKAQLGKCHIHGLPFDVPTTCSSCHGSGEVEDDDDYSSSPPLISCYVCHGTGIGFRECEMCLEEEDDA